MFYNTNFDVKYYDICKELKEKINRENTMEYSIEDIEVITNKLYQDELCSVFYAENIFDDKIDNGIRKIVGLIKKNKEIGYALEELEMLLFPKNNNYDNNNYENNKFVNDNDEKIDYEYLLFITLFSYHTFYLTHKIIKLELNGNVLPNEMVDELKQLVTNVLKNDIY